MRKFSTAWKNSKKQSKQRKFRLNAPLHIKNKFLHSHLSKELRKKYGRRNISLRKGDKVRIMRGQFRKLEGKVESIDLKKTEVFISGVEVTKKDGNKKLLPLNPSNLLITELNLDDKFRQKFLEAK